MSKHTPGPWNIRESNTQIGKCYRIAPDHVLDCGHGAALIYDDNTSLNPHGNGVVKANAHLIAAAPELYSDAVERSRADGWMLDQLEELKAYHGSMTIELFDNFIDSLSANVRAHRIGTDAAIAKAEGRQ